MIEVVTMTKAHLEEVLAHPSQKFYADYLSKDSIDTFVGQEYAYTFLRDGKPIACAGIGMHWNGRGEAWAFLIPGHRDVFLEIHNKVKTFLEWCPLRRLEATVDRHFKAGHRWVKALGFELEAPLMRGYGPTGDDFSLYAKVRF